MKGFLKRLSFWVLTVLAVILGILTLCVIDSESILHFVYLIGVNFALWFSIALYSARVRGFLAEKIKGIIYGFWIGVGKVFGFIKSGIRKLIQKADEFIFGESPYTEVIDYKEVKPRKSREDIERENDICYHIALNEKVDRIIEFCDKGNLPTTA